MKQNKLSILLFGAWSLCFSACTNTSPVGTSTVIIYEDEAIPANTGISTGTYTEVDGYRYVNVTVEFEQKAEGEAPVSLGVVFGHDINGQWGARRYFNFEQNFSEPIHPQMITLSGENSWHGHPHDKSTYIARLPVMAPYMQVFPFNHHDSERKIDVVLYLTE